MHVTRLLRWPASLVTPGPPAVDVYGDLAPGSEVSTPVLCHAFPGDSDEDTVSQHVESLTWTVYLPGSLAPPVSSSRLVLQGGPVLELTGPAMPWRNPRTGVVEYLEAPAKVVV